MNAQSYKDFAEGGRYFRVPLLVQLHNGGVIVADEAADNTLSPATMPDPRAYDELVAEKQANQHGPVTAEDLAALPTVFVPPIPVLPVRELRIEGDLVVLVFDGLSRGGEQPKQLALHVAPEEIRHIQRMERRSLLRQ